MEEGEFVWTIDNFLQLNEKNVDSPKFKFGIYDCFLDIFENVDAFCLTLYEVSLNYSGEYIGEYKKKFCKICLIDGSGGEFLIAQETISFQNETYQLLSFTSCQLLCEEDNRLPNGVLTVRLSWCDEEKNTCERDTQAASDLNLEKESRILLQTLSEDMGRLYENKVGADVMLRVGETLIPVHRAVLSTRSEVFAAMFRHDTLENRSGVVDISDVDASVFSDILYYVYSGQIRGMSADNVLEMYLVADKYALVKLMDACLNVLMRSLTVENVCAAALLAHTRGETKLEEEVVQFVKKNLNQIEETDKWKELSKFNSSLAYKLLRSVIVIYKDKETSESSK